MITARAWAGKRYAVLGLARSGAATVDALVASNAHVTAWDSDEAKRTSFPSPSRGEGAERSEAGEGASDTRSAAPHPSPDLAFGSATLSPSGRGTLTIADLDTLDLTQFDALVVSPGVPLNTHPLAAKARAAGVPIIGDIELFAQARSELPAHKVVGITGTNGKSTTTALVHHILKTAGVPTLMGGNIGLPILAQGALPEGGVYVLELSSYQIDLTQTLDCDVAVLLNITPDHLDRYAGFEAYAASKARLFAMQSVEHSAVFAGEDPSTTRLCNGENDRRRDLSAGNVIWTETDWEEDLGVSVFNGEATIYQEHVGWQREWPGLQGPHNARNASAAIAVCYLLGVALTKIGSALRTFTGLPHRTQTIRERNGVTYVNDSKATNPESTAPALAAFDRIHWIVGGRAKGDDLDACRPAFDHVVRAYTIGEAGPVFARVLKPEMQVAECGTLELAVNAASSAARPGETVLLSPAAASFDQFRDYEHRGDTFRDLVEALA